MMQISIIINVHKEGYILNETIQSVWENIKLLECNKISHEIIIIADKADNLTLEIAKTWAKDKVKIIKTEHGDLGLARNTGISAAQGEYIAFIDGDDLWGKGWLLSAFLSSIEDNRDVIWHPQYNLYFGDADYIFEHIDMEDPRFSIISLLQTNSWTALCFGKKELFIAVKYHPINHKKSIGYEDWSFNIDIVNHGYIHKIVPSTWHAIRRKTNSLANESKAAGSFPISFISDIFSKSII